MFSHPTQTAQLDTVTVTINCAILVFGLVWLIWPRKVSEHIVRESVRRDGDGRLPGALDEAKYGLTVLTIRLVGAVFFGFALWTLYSLFQNSFNN